MTTQPKPKLNEWEEEFDNKFVTDLTPYDEHGFHTNSWARHTFSNEGEQIEAVKDFIRKVEKQTKLNTLKSLVKELETAVPEVQTWNDALAYIYLKINLSNHVTNKE